MEKKKKSKLVFSKESTSNISAVLEFGCWPIRQCKSSTDPGWEGLGSQGIRKSVCLKGQSSSETKHSKSLGNTINLDSQGQGSCSHEQDKQEPFSKGF